MLPKFSEGTPFALTASLVTSIWLYILSYPVGIQAQALTLSVGAFFMGLVSHYWFDFSVSWAGVSGILLGTITLLFPFNNPQLLNSPADLMAIHYIFIFGAYFTSYMVVKVGYELNFGELSFEE